MRMIERLENNRQIPFGDKQRPYEIDMTAGKRFGEKLTLGLVRSGSVSRRDNAVSNLEPNGWVRVAVGGARRSAMMRHRAAVDVWSDLGGICRGGGH